MFRHTFFLTLDLQRVGAVFFNTQTEIYMNKPQKASTGEYSTKDLYEAAALTSSGQELLHLRRTGNYYLFVFNDWDTCRKISTKFYNKQLFGNLKDHSESIKTLKGMLFNRQNAF